MVSNRVRPELLSVYIFIYASALDSIEYSLAAALEDI
jgi:hypothetical protein